MHVISLPNIHDSAIGSSYAVTKYISFQIHFKILNASTKGKIIIDSLFHTNNFSIKFLWYQKLFANMIKLKGSISGGDLTAIPTFYNELGIAHCILKQFIFMCYEEYYNKLMQGMVFFPSMNCLIPTHVVINSNPTFIITNRSVSILHLELWTIIIHSYIMIVHNSWSAILLLLTTMSQINYNLFDLLSLR